MKIKGFTLIELLAVIVILAIIALIATPIILNIISDAREESNERSVELYANAIKNAVARHQLNGGGAVVGNYTSEQLEDLITVDIDGEVDCKTIQLSEDGRVSLSGCTVNGSTKEYKYGDPEDVEIVKACAHTDVDNSGTINLSDTVTCGSENFYVISNNGSAVDVLTKYGLNVGQYQYANEATYGIQEEHVGEYNDDYNVYGAVAFADVMPYWATSEDGSTFVNLSTYPTAFIYDENSNIYQYVEAYETYLKDTVKVTSASASVINEAQWSILDGKSWVSSPMAWTGLHDGVSGTESGGGNTTTNGPHPPSQSTDVVIRPVITISVSEIQ